MFPANGDYYRSIRENTRAGTSLGAPVRATDENNDRLTYTIGTSDYFEIADSTGQLRTKLELDREDWASHAVTVTATDPGGLTGTVTVTVTVEDADETPVVSGPTALEFEEGTSTGSILATYMASDPDRKGIDLALTGTDSEDFSLSNGGDLTFNNIPDFEEPADSGGNNDYRVTVEAQEQGDGTSVGSLSVTVRVTNIDEPGVVEVPVSEPIVGQQLTSILVDPDEGVSSIEWKWESREPGGEWTSIPGATSRSYTPTEDDNGKELRVVVIYRDRQGPGKTSTHEFTESVVLRPFFPAATAARSMQENIAVGRNVGRRFMASHPDSVNLTYTLGGSDAGFFAIDASTSQLKTSDIPLDFETQPGPEAKVQVTATDPDNEAAIITVTISVTNVCAADGEEPCAPGRPSVRYDPGTDTNLLVSWSAPRSNAEITGYDLQYRESDNDDFWTTDFVAGTGRSHTIESLTKGTRYEVQVKARNSHGDSLWSSSATGRPGVPPPPPPPPDTETQQPPTTTTTTTGGGGGGGGGNFGGFAPPQPPRPVVNVQPAKEVFRPLSDNGSLVRVWRFLNRWQRWEFYDPGPGFEQFNTLERINLSSDSPAIAIINVSSSQRFRGYTLRRGWNYIPIEDDPPARIGRNVQQVGEVFIPMVENGTLNRVWWLDSRTQEWKLFDPDPELAPFNTLETVNLATSPPVVVVVTASRGQSFRGQNLYRGSNYIVLR